MLWNSQQLVHNMQDGSDDSIQDHGAAEHMTANACLRESDDDDEFAGVDLDIAAKLKRIATVTLAVSRDIIHAASKLHLIRAPFEQP